MNPSSSTGEITLRVVQTQGRDHGTPIYRTPVQIGIVTPAGKRVEEVWLGEEEDVFTFTSSEAPLLVRFDEGNWLLKEWTYEKSREELLYQARNDDAIGREWAVRQLVGSSVDPQVRDLLFELSLDDPFWAVRKAALEVLGAEAVGGDLGPVKRAALDTNSQVRRAALALLGQMADPQLATFFMDRFEQDDSYPAQAEALRAIGKIGDPQHLPFLERAMEIPSHRGLIREAAEEAIQDLSGRP